MSIIRKILAALVTLALLLACAALAEEEPAVTSADFLGEWVDQDGTCNIEIEEHGDEEIDGCIVTVCMSVIDGENYGYVVWAYGCVWDDEVQALKSISRVTGEGDYEPDSEENITDINYEYTDAEFYFDDAGLLIWSDSGLEADDGLAFERTIGWDGEAMPEGAAAFDGDWQCDRASIAMYWEEEGFKVLIRWGSSAWEHTEWEYSCFYDEENNTLVSMPFGTRTDCVYGDDGELASATEVYNDGAAAFALTEEGFLTWDDEKENAGDGMLFERIPEQADVE